MGTEGPHLVKTVGAPRAGDPRDGELHEFFGPLKDHFDLEPWDDDSRDEDARYYKQAGPPEFDENGRAVWLYVYRAPDR
jgi:hypothetical protein